MDYIVKVYKDWKLHSQFHEIVPDMDEDFIFNEKQSIRDSARSLKKYGSTCYNQSLRSNETLVRHEVEKTDTLQGIALKYGCTTEQIRRANRLFASDSLFLRQFLLIPVEKSSPFFSMVTEHQDSDDNNLTGGNGKVGSDMSISRVPSSLSTTSASSSSHTSSENFSQNNSHPLQMPDESSYTTSPAPPNPSTSCSLKGNCPNCKHSSTDKKSTCSSCTSSITGGSGKHSKSLDSMVAPIPPEEENRRCINEFLNKIDNTISESRKYVERSREIMMASQSDGDLFTFNNSPTFGNTTPHSNSSRKNAIRYSNSQNITNSDTIQLLNTTQMRHVQNSLRRLEQQQDEFFEL